VDAVTGSMTGRTVLITGGTGGIGKATAAGLARLGAAVVIVGRDHQRGEAAVAEIRRQTGSPSVDLLLADVSIQAEVRRLAEQALERYARLDVLVNNVGGHWATRRTTADGLEHTLAVNHLAPFLLTNLLLERLVRSAPARIVTVSSGAQAMGRIDFEDLQAERGYSGQRAYSQSKLANVMFTYELARRLEGTGVTATVLHPGVVRTNFGSEDPARLMRPLIWAVRPFMKTPKRGAHTSIYLASSPEVEGINGRYFANCKPRRSAERSYDREAAARLWRVSAALVALTEATKARGTGRPVRLGVHVVNFTLPGGPPAIGPTLADIDRAAEDAGVWQRPHPPILIGGSGEKKRLRLVARYGDACNIFAGPHSGPDVVRSRLEVLRGHCQREGTDYDRLRRTILYVGRVNATADGGVVFADEMTRYADVGVQEVMVMPGGPDPVGIVRWLGTHVVPSLAEL